MSLNSLQDDMSRRAASMAAMAKRARNPQEIQAIQRSLINGVQSGAIAPYVGIPLIQELTQRLPQAQAAMAQSMAGAGMPQAPQGGAPIAQQVMAQAAQDSQGVESLQSNLPESYAGGGIIAFEDGGQVEKFSGGGNPRLPVPGAVYSATNPNIAFADFLKQLGMSTTEFANARPEAQRQISDMFRSGTGAPTAPAAPAATPAATTAPATSTAPQKGVMFKAGQLANTAKQGVGNFMSRGLADLVGGRTLGGLGLALTPSALGDDQAVLAAMRGEGYQGQPYSVENARKVLEGAGMDPNRAPPAAPPVVNPYDPETATRRSMYETAPPPAPDAPAAPGAPAFKMPGLQAFMPKPAVLPERTMDPLTDLNAIVSGMPEKTKKAAEDAVKETQAKLEEMDKPGFEAREGRLGKREATQEKDSAIGRALNLMNLGFGIAGSKERTLAGALGNEGRQGIRDLIQGEAANRAARDRLEEYRDNLEQQKVAARKGNYSAAQAAGKSAADDLRSATALSLQGAQAGNAQAISMYNTLTQGDIGRATVANQGQQLQQSAVDSANRNTLTAAGLGLQARQLAQTGDFQTKQLSMMEQRYKTMDKASQARMQQVRAKAFSDFTTSVAPQLNAQLTAEYGKNWRTGTDARSLQAQMLFNQQKNSYLLDALGQYDDRTSARDSSDL